MLSTNNIVIYESTVYPGVTEDVCVPELEAISGLVFNRDFYCGYCPERINPGDKVNTLQNVMKITSGSTKEAAAQVDELYRSVIPAGTHLVSSIKVAEASKVIENTQRDVNIALINELSIIFNKLNIDTEAVLKAAETKWNFISFRPGLVGGHCIGVDPYYLTYKSLSVGYKPEMILAGRQINDNMGLYVVNQVCDLMAMKKIDIGGSNVLIMGLTFKENCPDLRNSRIVDLILEFKKLNCNVDVYDPWVNKEIVSKELAASLVDNLTAGKYDAVILAVAHDIFKELSVDEIRALGKDDHILYDIKFALNANQVDGRL
jgi:UDP-N-acetyl-D-galactosamine dehydrogenase